MPETKRNFKILCVYAHPADLCCEGSGTVALQAERGDDYHVLAGMVEADFLRDILDRFFG